MEKYLRLLSRPGVFVVLCVVIVAVWAAWAFIVRSLIQDSWQNRGLSGDMYGSLNALFTGLAFAGLLYTIVVQKLSRLDDEKEKQRQQFEATFFQLIRSLEGIVAATDLQGGSHKNPLEIKGRDCFTKLFNLLDPKFRD